MLFLCLTTRAHSQGIDGPGVMELDVTEFGETRKSSSQRPDSP